MGPTYWPMSLPQAGILFVAPLLAESDWPEEIFSISQMIADGSLQSGGSVELTDHLFTAQRFGPVLVGAIWELGQKDPLLLVSNLDFLSEARFWYTKRFGIETFFSDQKSRGFYLCHSHLSDPERLGRLLIATRSVADCDSVGC
jgi:hypothetical protein